jgi:LacI family transcriptional regulator
LAADYLLQLGHRRVGAVAPRFEGQQTLAMGIKDRLLGWSDALANRDIAADPSWQRVVDIGQDGQISDKSAHDLHDFLRAPSRPTAIFVPAHIPAVNLYQACLEAGLRVPQDISLVVFDHVPAMSSPRVKFTTCLVDRELMGKVAWECLQSRIERKSHVVMKHVLPAHMVEGQTTQRPALNAGA